MCVRDDDDVAAVDHGLTEQSLPVRSSVHEEFTFTSIQGPQPGTITIRNSRASRFHPFELLNRIMTLFFKKNGGHTEPSQNRG